MPDSATKHCTNLSQDRNIGAMWERNFCRLAAQFGRTFTPMQIGREQSAQAYGQVDGKWNQWTLPDVTVWTCPGEHHEIKHKEPTPYDSFGLERYRLDALEWFMKETGQVVFYTIHRHDLNGGRESKSNHIEHWFTANVQTLVEAIASKVAILRRGPSWCGGKKIETLIVYWPVRLWAPLADNWKQ